MALDRFAEDILMRCRIARTGYGGHPNGAWSTGEQLAVALVLRDWGHLTDMDYTEVQAMQRISGDIGGSLENVLTWINAIRAELEA
jgi:hypothetical protein